jgi:O-antigen/teichoic acid export membrane protein
MIIAGRLSGSSDSIIIGYLYGAAVASIYYTSQMPGTLIYQLLWKISDNAAPALNELWARRAALQLNSAYIRLLRYSLILALGLALGLLAFNRDAITLWVGAAQYGGGLLTVSLAALAITQVVNHLNALMLVAYGQIKRMSLLCFFSGIARVALAFWLGRSIGLAGVLIAAVLADTPGFFYLSHCVFRLQNLRVTEVFWSALVPALTANVLILPFLAILLITSPLGTWHALLLGVAAFSALWCVGVFAMGLLPTERAQVRVSCLRILKLRASN